MANSISLRGLFDRPPEWLSSTVKDVASEPEVRAWLYQKGQDIVSSATSDEPPNPWVSEILGPFLDPVSEGAIDAGKKILWRYVIVASAAGLLLGALVFGGLDT